MYQLQMFLLDKVRERLGADAIRMGQELVGADLRAARKPAARPNTGSGGHHGYRRDLVAEFGRHIAREQVEALHHARIHGVGERASELIADRR